MRDYYIVLVTIGGRVLESTPILLKDAELLVADIKNAAPNTTPQIIYETSY